MSDIVISSGVRSNLLNLQRTSDLIATTQNRLATGKKVNSALDNPTNFFTASSLNSRANDLGNLLDGLSNGIKTLEAADNGLKAITRTVETLQSTVRQARQDKSFKTETFSLGQNISGKLSFSGGAIGATAVEVDLAGQSGPTPTTLTAANSPLAGAFGGDFDGGTLSIGGNDVTLTGGTPPTASTVTGVANGTFGASFAGGNLTINGQSIAIDASAPQAASSEIAAGANDFVANSGNFSLAALDGETLTLSSGSNVSTFSFSSSTTAADLDNFASAEGFTVTRTTKGLDISRADGEDFVITTSATAVNDALGITSATTVEVTNGVTAADAYVADVDSVIADINEKLTTAGVTNVVADKDDVSGNLTFTAADGSDVRVAGDNTFLQTLGLANTTGVNELADTSGEEGVIATLDSVIDEINTQLEGKGITASNDNGKLSLSRADGADLTITASDPALLDALGFGNGTVGTPGNITTLTSDTGEEAVGAPTVESLVSDINNNENLKGRVRASNVNGQLRIENLSTSELKIGGINSGKIDGGSSEGTVGGNSTRTNLASQFNDLRSQLDRLADDSGFNGINLLRGDKLRLSFNETGTSSIDIEAKDAEGVSRGISSEELGIDEVSAEQFESDEDLDQILNGLGNALGELRAQSSSFGSNLSSVQNRQDFTRATINTLRTGADNLTLANVNEEAANLLSLQTRQQLSNTSLSLASQADQSVLRLL